MKEAEPELGVFTSEAPEFEEFLPKVTHENGISI